MLTDEQIKEIALATAQATTDAGREQLEAVIARVAAESGLHSDAVKIAFERDRLIHLPLRSHQEIHNA